VRSYGILLVILAKIGGVFPAWMTGSLRNYIARIVVTNIITKKINENRRRYQT
jgi:hypothetical protein